MREKLYGSIKTKKHVSSSGINLIDGDYRVLGLVSRQARGFIVGEIEKHLILLHQTTIRPGGNNLVRERR